MRQALQIQFRRDFWLNLVVNILTFLTIFLPLSTIISQLLLIYNWPKYWFFWKEFLVGIVILTSLKWLLKNRYWLRPIDWLPSFILILITFWIICWSFFKHQLPLQAILIGFRFELWWLYFWAILDLVFKVIKNWQKLVENLEIGKAQINLIKKPTDSKNLPKSLVEDNTTLIDSKKVISKDNLKELSKHLADFERRPRRPHSENEDIEVIDSADGQNGSSGFTFQKTDSTENFKPISHHNFLSIIQNFSPQELKIWQEQNLDNYCWLFQSWRKLHLALYLGFFWLVIIFGASQFWGQEVVLAKFGFGQNSLSNQPQLCHVVDFGQNQCRLSAGLSSPNHLAAYLLMLLPVFWADLFGKNNS